MKIKKLITFLTKYYNKYGNLEIVTDTEGAEYKCHLIEIKGIYLLKQETKNILYLTLDDEMKQYERHKL